MGVALVIVNHLRTATTMLHEILPHYPKKPFEVITEKLGNGAKNSYPFYKFSCGIQSPGKVNSFRF
jgi:hypothetical protein